MRGRGEEKEGGVASAADIDRDGSPPGEDEKPLDGVIGEETEEDEAGSEQSPEVLEGALSKEQAEALLRALQADQKRRREERTEREGKRGRRGAKKDW